MKQSVCVLVVIDQKILAVSRKNDFTIFGMPGGKTELNENLEAAAIRETQEEAGITVSDLEELYADQCGQYFCTTFFAHKYHGNPKTPANNEGLVKLLSIDEFLSNNAFPKYNTTVIKKWKKRFNLE